MAAVLLEINSENPPERKIKEVVDCLERGGIIIYPTDTIYGIGCDIFNAKALQRLCQIKGMKTKKMDFSFICYDLSDISQYAKQLDNSTFKVMKKALPGPFTFILEASGKVPKIFNADKKQVGIRVPNHEIPRMIVKMLGRPIVSSSIKDEDQIVTYTTDPSLIYDNFKNLVDMVIDGGMGMNVPSTIVDCTKNNFEVVRQGAGDLSLYI